LSLPVYAYAKIEYDVLWNDTTKMLTDHFYTKVSQKFSNFFTHYRRTLVTP
jgi:hypothetical protein